MLISTTHFTLKSWRLYPAFFLDTYRVAKQVRRSGGLIRMRIKPFALRTLSVWESEQQMREFRTSHAHLHAMKKTRYYGSTVSVSWEADSVPGWLEAIGRLDAQRKN